MTTLVKEHLLVVQLISMKALTHYIYTDIIEHQVVGGSMLPLLRVVLFKNDGKQEYAWMKYNPPPRTVVFLMDTRIQLKSI